MLERVLAASPLLALLALAPTAQTGSCGPCPNVGACPPVLPLESGSDHSCEDLTGEAQFGAFLSDVDLSFADISNTHYGQSFLTGCSLDGAHAISTIFTQATLELGSAVGTDFTNAAMGTSFYFKMDMREAVFSGAVMFGANFQGSDLSEAVLTDAITPGTLFTGANLTNAVGLDSLFTIPGYEPFYDCATDFTGTGFDPEAAGWVRLKYDSLDWLAVDVEEISLSAGGTQTMTLDAGESLGSFPYLVVGSASGTAPGIVLPPFASTLPLNLDDYLLYTLTFPNGLIQGSLGVLSPCGFAEASLTLAPGALDASLVGITLHHSYVVTTPTFAVQFASPTARPLTFVP